MAVYQQLVAGNRLPDATLAILENALPVPVQLQGVIRGRRVLIAGLPGAFTPTCSNHHLPNLIANAEKLRASGMEDLLCIAPNDPWVLREWAQRLNTSAITFLSDGNLDFVTRCGLTFRGHDHFLGLRSQRFAIVVHDLTVQRVMVEPDPLSFTCTDAAAVLAT